MFVIKFKLDEQQMEEITERAATKAATKVLNGMYLKVGQTVVNRIFYVVGAAATSIIIYLHNKGIL